MRRYALAVVLLLAAVFATAVGTIRLDTSVRLEIINCASGGSSDAGAGLGNTLAAGDYIFRVLDDDVWLCYAATCATDGERFPVGTVMTVQVRGSAGQLVSCRSAGSTGDIVFTRIIN